MVSTGGDKLCSDKFCADKDEFAECVDNINVLNLRLKNSDDRCQRLRTDLRLAKQVCEVIGSPSPPPPPPPLLLSSLLRDSPIHDHRWVQQDPTASASQLVSRWKNLVFKALLLHLRHRGTDNRGWFFRHSKLELVKAQSYGCWVVL